MSQQDYDFFATGRPQQDPVVPPPPPAPTRPGQFAGHVDPQGRPVNQFGTPIGEAAVPVGPNAAPGYGAAPAATWGGPPVGAPYPSAPLHARAGGLPGQADGRPGAVLAAGVIGIVQGALLLVMSLLALAAVGVLKSQVPDSNVPGARGLWGFVALFMIVLALIALLYLVAGIGTVRGRRWAVWTLGSVEAVGLALGLLVAVSGNSSSAGGSLVQLLDLLIPGAVVVLLLLPDSRRWLRQG